MNREAGLIREPMKTPRAAAVAGIIFSLLLTASFSLIRISVPASPLSEAAGFIKHAKAISLALNLLPFAGIAFLWFIAVLRDRLGNLEDRFFATVFFGSGLLFVGMIFTSAATAGGIITILSHDPAGLIQSGGYSLGRGRSLSNLEHLRSKDGRRVHDGHVHDFASNPDLATLDVVPRLRPGADSPSERGND
jgi:hypothetical protein